MTFKHIIQIYTNPSPTNNTNFALWYADSSTQTTAIPVSATKTWELRGGGSTVKTMTHTNIQFASANNDPRGICYDGSQYLYITNNGNQTINRVSVVDGTSTTLPLTGDALVSPTFGVAYYDNALYVCTGTGLGNIQKINLASSNVSTFSTTTIGNPVGICVVPTGSHAGFYVSCNDGGGFIYKIDLTMGAKSTYFTHSNTATSFNIIYNPADNCLYGTRYSLSHNQVYKITLSGSPSLSIAHSLTGVNFVGIAIYNGYTYLGKYASNSVVNYKTASATGEFFGSTGSFLYHMIVVDGFLYICAPTLNKVLRFPLGYAFRNINLNANTYTLSIRSVDGGTITDLVDPFSIVVA